MRVLGKFVIGGRNCEVLGFDESPNKKVKDTADLETEAGSVKANMQQFDAELLMRHWRDIPLEYRQSVSYLFLKYNFGSAKDYRYIRFENDGIPRELRTHAGSKWMTKDCRVIRFC